MLPSDLHFGPFRLDAQNDCIWRNDHPVPLRAKSLFVLRYLVSRAGRLVRKDELLEAGWPETHVTDVVLKVCIREIRQALADDPENPQFIQTVHGRGYRFIAAIGNPTATPAAAAALLVGRQVEMEQLLSAWDSVRQGQRRTLLISGEAGIGKTSLVRAFLDLAARDHPWLLEGHCVEQFGPGEPYLPILEAVAGLCREAPLLVPRLARHAPTWLAQMPWLIDPSGRQAFAQELAGANQQRMLREAAHFFEELSHEKPLVLLIEDLHWSDHSTLDLVSFMARRDAARLLLIATYRPAESTAAQHPLRKIEFEIESRRRGRIFPLRFLNAPEIMEYVQARFPRNGLQPAIASWIHSRTEGNPLLIVNVVDQLVAEGHLAEAGGSWILHTPPDRIGEVIPHTIRNRIESRVAELPEERRRTLAAASVAGIQFSAEMIAAALETDSRKVEDICEELVIQNDFVHHSAADRARYAFTHAFYQRALYDAIPPGRRAHYHLQMARFLAKSAPEGASEIASELAAHFAEGRDYSRAIDCYILAARKAMTRFANHDAQDLLAKAIALLSHVPADIARDRQELQLRIAMGVTIGVLNGYGAPEAGACFERARQLWRALGESIEFAPMLSGPWRYYLIRADLGAARDLAEHLLAAARTSGDTVSAIEAGCALGVTLLNCGDFAAARASFDEALAAYVPDTDRSRLSLPGHDPAVVCRAFGSWALWSLGYSGDALRQARDSLAIARRLGHPESVCFGLLFTAWTHHLERNVPETQRWAAVMIRYAGYHGIPQFVAFGRMLRGWAMGLGGNAGAALSYLRETEEVCLRLGSEISRPHFMTMIAEVAAAAGKRDDAIATLDQAIALAGKTGGGYFQAETWRIKGELLYAADPNAARECFERAIEIAVRQQARSFELRARMAADRAAASRGRPTGGRCS